MLCSILVTIEANASLTEIIDYIKDALVSYGGQYNPDNPFFGTNKKIEVNKVTKTKGERQFLINKCKKLRESGLTYKAISKLCNISISTAMRYSNAD